MKRFFIYITFFTIVTLIFSGSVFAQQQACEDKCDEEFGKCLKDNAASSDGLTICGAISDGCLKKCETDNSSGLEDGASCPTDLACKSGFCLQGRCAPKPDPTKPPNTDTNNSGSDPNSNPSTPSQPGSVPVVLPEANGVSFFGLFDAATVPELIVKLYKYSISIVGIMIFIQFVRAGFVYLTAAGNAGKTGQATHLMTNAVIGAILLFSAYLILNVINPDLLTLQLDLSQPPGSAASVPGDNTNNNGGTATIGSLGMTGTCKGVSCSEPEANICGDTTSANCGGPDKWGQEIFEGVRLGGAICNGIKTEVIVAAIMSQESHGDPKAGSSKGAAGLMQLLPSTANDFKSKCGVTENIDTAWLQNPANATKSICIAIQKMKAGVGSCGCSVRNISAFYNGNPQACDESRDCGSGAGAGACSVCQGESPTRKWQCPWNESEHTTCNNTLSDNFAETRKYVPKVSYCYKKLGG